MGLGLSAIRSANAAPAAPSRPVVVVHFDSAIDEVAVRYIGGALEDAKNADAELVIIEMTTPGGSVDSMRSIVSDILDSPIPVAVWIGPPGSRAASAGTFVAAASSYLAMAPATNIGAAAVVGSQGENLPSTEAKKATQDVAALMRSIAAKRHRPVDALEATILEAKSYSAEEAVNLGIADSVAPTLNGLVDRLDGHELATSAGPKVVHTIGAPRSDVHMTFWQRVLEFLSDPNLVFLLLNLGGLGLIIELWMGGQTWIPGALGIICLLAAFAGLSVLPFSWAGLALILVGLVFLGFELHAPGHLVFGVAGTASIILGGIFMLGYFGSPGLPGYNPSISLWVLITLAVVVGLLVTWMAREVHLSHHGRRYVSPVEKKALVGEEGEVSTRLDPKGEVWVGGEAWQATLDEGGTLEAGEQVRVVAAKGFHLMVRPLEKAPIAEDPKENEKTI
jgi:membrane-bound serine protease (ClpP class)